MATLVTPAGKRFSELERLRRPPTRTMGTAFAHALERVDEIGAFGLGRVKLNKIPPNRLTALARYGLGSKAAGLERASGPAGRSAPAALVVSLVPEEAQDSRSSGEPQGSDAARWRPTGAVWLMRCGSGAAASTSGLQVVENWNGANDYKIFYGKDGVLTGEDREHAEASMLALHLLQSSLVYVNTQLIQAVLRDPEWADRLTPEDRRGLSPLFWTHINPYGRFYLDMDTGLDLTAA